jgi:serine/threonine protein kinase/tetratricopeptide (TPR) repeat protein
MARVDADRNLLFGLVALQNNFIDRGALLDAFGRWVHDHAVPLGQVLRDRGHLRPDEHDLLHALVAKHLEKFGGDPEKSLRNLSAIGSVRQELSRIADGDLKASLAHVSAARPNEDPYRTLTGTILGESSSIGTRFRILRPHAMGGLGQVSVALDQELDRPVALKEIQDRHADEQESRARFVQEAEITGKLEHPGIIPVYGLGHDVAGRPFYAMRFVEGDSLKEAVEAFHGDNKLKKDPAERDSRLRELLRRFTDVCNAVAYAHSRGVLHRDLKPGNVMLGPYGETLVVDWGLAKPVRDVLSAESASADGSSLMQGPIRLSGQSGSRAETVAGSPIGTPAYASPEQLTGAMDRLGPATDIYGLGATLYSVLTGRLPVESNDLGELIRRVQRGEITPPRSIDTSIPKPLESICRRAMSVNPEDRYVSARALSKDVTKWLDDEPVTAYREPVSVRVGRWMRRHRTAMVGAAAAGLVGFVGLGAVAAVQKVANERISLALQAETKAKIGARDALTRSEEAREQAEAVLGFLKDDILATARPEGENGGLGVGVTVRKAVDAAESKIAARFKDQPIVEAQIRDTLAKTYLDLGDAKLAIRQVDRALQLFESKVGLDDPITLAARQALAVCYEKAGRTDEAIKLHEATLKQRESKLGPDHPDTLSSRHSVAVAYGTAGRTDEAIKLHEATLKQCESKLGPDHAQTLASRTELAWLYQAVDRIDDAIEMHEATLEQRQSKLGPEHPETLSSRNYLATAYENAGRIDDAIRMHEATLALRQAKLGPDHPDTLISRDNLAMDYVDAGRADEAIRMYEATLKQWEAILGSDHPDTLISLMSLAGACRAAGQRERAASLFEQALRGFRVKVGADHPHTNLCARRLAELYMTGGQFTRADTLLRDSLDRARKRFGSADPYTTATMALLGSNLIQQRKWSDAETVLRECLAIREKAQPDEWSTFNTRSHLGASLLGQKKYAEAEPLILAGYEGMKAREAKIPTSSKPRMNEAGRRVVQLYEAWGKKDNTAEWRAKLAEAPHEVTHKR